MSSFCEKRQYTHARNIRESITGDSFDLLVATTREIKSRLFEKMDFSIFRRLIKFRCLPLSERKSDIHFPPDAVLLHSFRFRIGFRKSKLNFRLIKLPAFGTFLQRIRYHARKIVNCAKACDFGVIDVFCGEFLSVLEAESENNGNRAT